MNRKIYKVFVGSTYDDLRERVAASLDLNGVIYDELYQ
jgi:hypothetical protein